jgi:Transcriptional regulatory protein, C terminal
MAAMMQRLAWFKPALRLLIVITLTGVSGLLFVQLTSSGSPADAARSSEKINLALRRTAHHLLRAAGDSTSRIATVIQSDPQTYRLRLDHAFDYERLPKLIQSSFRAHQITGAYDVAVLDCTTGALELGYTVGDLTNGEPVPCVGRSRKAGCYVLQVTFAPPAASPPPPMPWSILSLVGVSALLITLVWRRSAQAVAADSLPEKAPESPNLLRFGQSSLDLANLLLLTGPHKHNLTYREAKLLRVLASHPNQVLERDQILKLVWQDEGITVGRSIDVFVSRLRKLLSHDPTIKITAVHGIGYRMEVG